MSHTLISALWITLIGMGLVFIALLLLWGLMELMVRLTSRSVEEKPPPETAPAVPCGNDQAVQRAKAAAAAVAVVIACANAQPAGGAQISSHGAAVSKNIAGAPGAASAWQSANRSSQINQNAALYNRKPRGNE